MIEIEWITQIILTIWLTIATIAIILMNKILKNHEALLFHLRDEIAKNRYKEGHIFCKTTDKDFNTCKGITLNDMEDIK